MRLSTSNRNRILVGALATLGLAQIAVAQSSTSAYWRHEAGPVGASIPSGPDSVLDSSGNANHMQTFDPTFTSASYSTAVTPRPLLSGLPNNFSLDFGPGGDDGGQNDDNYTAGKPIQDQRFSAMTVEMAFNMDFVGGYQAIFGKDGRPVPGNVVPPLKVLIRGDGFPGDIPNQLFVEFIDGKGATHFVTSRQTVVAGQWNHMAFTLTGTTAELWVATGADAPYTLLDSITGDFAAPTGEALIADGGSFTVGRGMFDNNVADFSDAKIDEVRVSNVALLPSQFLFAAVPEPTAAVPAILAGAGFLGRRRRQA